MQPARKKTREDIPEKYADLAAAQEKAVEIIKTHLAGPLKEIRAMGYTRVELATTYLMLAYHALRHDKPKKKAEEVLDILTYFAKRRIESGIKEKQKKNRLH